MKNNLNCMYDCFWMARIRLHDHNTLSRLSVSAPLWRRNSHTSAWPFLADLWREDCSNCSAWSSLKVKVSSNKGFLWQMYSPGASHSLWSHYEQETWQPPDDHIEKLVQMLRCCSTKEFPSNCTSSTLEEDNSHLVGNLSHRQRTKTATFLTQEVIVTAISFM